MKVKKKKKSVGQRGRTTYGHGARKKWKKSGHKGGVGMAGTGKRADHKKTLINKLYGNKYFGKQGITSKGTKRDKRKRINIIDIEKNLSKFSEKDGWIDLSEYKVLGDGEIKNKLKIKALSVSKNAKEKIEKAGGKIEVLSKNINPSE
ncbi:MAG: uL15 family ribosomal protein [Nanoarchaeota archaeon]